MKNRFFVNTMSLFFILSLPGCAKTPSKEDAESKEEIESHKINLLEKAIDPYSGTKKDLSELRDNGGLNSISDFYGLSISHLEAEYKNNESKTLDFAQLIVPATTAPKLLRKALDQACHTNTDSWKITDEGSVLKGEASNQNVRCTYLQNTDSSDRSFEVAIFVN